MKEEFIKLHNDYCNAVDKLVDDGAMGYTRGEEVKWDFQYFIRWLKNGEKTYFY